MKLTANRYGWITVPEHYYNDENFWNELGGVFFPVGMKGNRHKIGDNYYILGESEWFDKFEEDDINLAPTFMVNFDEMGQFMDFEEMQIFI